MPFPCPDCDGTGTIDLTPANSPSQAQLRGCPSCDGEGTIRCQAYACSAPAEVETDEGYYCEAHLPHDE